MTQIPKEIYLVSKHKECKQSKGAIPNGQDNGRDMS
uniref:Uncharacterized protein n=1 Tax=Rhizophora mucronata TaxID=61149 RepID=A0A2P2R1X8_RHIMU